MPASPFIQMVNLALLLLRNNFDPQIMALWHSQDITEMQQANGPVLVQHVFTPNREMHAASMANLQALNYCSLAK